jgi:hypothetical protein
MRIGYLTILRCDPAQHQGTTRTQKQRHVDNVAATRMDVMVAVLDGPNTSSIPNKVATDCID